jgi:maltose O-acetyltransferase
VAVENQHRIELGERVRLDGRTVRIELVSWTGPLLIGEGTFINYGASISAHAGVTIGRNVLIGNYVLIMDSDYHDVYDRTLPGPSAPIIIEDNAWIGARAIILKGVRVGEGAIVAAGAIVTADVPPRTVVAGPAARVVREL